MAAPLDWAAFSEADEESRQALLKRAAKLDPSIQVALQSTTKKCRKKTGESAELTDKKSAKAVGSKKTVSKKTASGAAVSVVKEEEGEKLGSAAWVAKQLEALGLAKYAPRLASALPLELLVHVDQAQLDILLRQCKSEPMPDTMDYIKLQCAIRAMHVKVSGMTGSPAISRHIKESVHPTQASSSTSAKDASSLLQGDILTWSVSDTMIWMREVPALSRFVELFERCEMDGHRLLRLNDRKLLQRMKIESETDRTLIMQHIGDLKALQVTTAVVLHSDIVNKLIKGLASELAHTSLKIAASPTAGGVSMLSAKRVPNYFISLRIGSLDLRSRVKKIQGEIEALIPELAGSRSILPPEQLHFTLGRLYLHTEEEIALAKRLLESCHDEVYQRLYPQSSEVAVNFRGVMNYGGNTVFLETERGNERDLLIEFGNTVYDMFQAAGLTSKEFRFQPVAPIIRVRQSKKPLTSKLQDVSESLLENYASASLGRNVFSSLDISAVADQTDADGYYCNLHSVLLK